jgi:hypothetical protein
MKRTKQRKTSPYALRRSKITIEDFYTKPQVVDNILKTYIVPCMKKLGTTHFVDTSAGNGYLLCKLKEYIPHVHTIGYDLYPPSKKYHPVKKEDFLKVRSLDKGKIEKSYMIGFNPPFGINGMLAKKFIEHAVELYSPKCVIMILPFICTLKKYKGLKLLKSFRLEEESFYRPQTKETFSHPTFLCIFQNQVCNGDTSKRTEGEQVWPANIEDMYQYVPETLPDKTILVRRIGANSGKCGWVKLNGCFQEYYMGVLTGETEKTVQIIPKTFITIRLQPRTSLQTIKQYILHMAEYKMKHSYKRTFSVNDVVSALTSYHTRICS